MAIAFLLIAYALVNIIKAKIEIKQTLEYWNQTTATSIVPSANSNLTETEVPLITEPAYVHYDKEFSEGDVIGKLYFPDITKEIPLITGIKEKHLSKGALHYGNTVLPGLEGNSIILGHREGVFSFLKKLQENDQFEIITTNNHLLFTVVEIRIIEPDDKSVFDYYGFPSVTLETCYPFTYGGPAPQRYIVIGKLSEIK